MTNNKDLIAWCDEKIAQLDELMRAMQDGEENNIQRSKAAQDMRMLVRIKEAPRKDERASMKMGSLFDGSGGFPLAASTCGIEPVWASEIEPFPIRVTTKRFPNVKHLGSVTDINGAGIEPVDIITFGSPCQDLSVAGKRAGLQDGERSSLFFEAIRIIKEMREHARAAGRADVDIRPRYIVWENVPGAYASNGGDDFRCVLEEICKVADPEVSIPRPDKGKWQPAGCIMGGALLCGVAHLRRSVLGSPPASPSNLPCRRFCRSTCRRNTI